ncbi:unnamed protein product [Ectocarpus fasciculatus]
MKICTSSALFGLLYVEAQAGCPADFSFVLAAMPTPSPRGYSLRGASITLSLRTCATCSATTG